jgi:hypothetical protein
MSTDASAQKPEAKEKMLLGAPVGEWTKGGIQVLAGVVLGVFGYWLAGSKPHLTVKVSEIAKFQGDKHNPGFASIHIQSDGSKEAEEVECRFTLNNVQEVKISPDNLNATWEVKDARVSVKTAVMNPGESLTIAAYTSNTAGVPERPEVSVRGKGVVGESEAPGSSRNWWFITASALAAGAAMQHFMTRSSYKAGFRKGRNDAIEEFTEGLKKRFKISDAELDDPPINDTR